MAALLAECLERPEKFRRQAGQGGQWWRAATTGPRWPVAWSAFGSERSSRLGNESRLCEGYSRDARRPPDGVALRRRPRATGSRPVQRVGRRIARRSCRSPNAACARPLLPTRGGGRLRGGRTGEQLPARRSRRPRGRRPPAAAPRRRAVHQRLQARPDRLARRSPRRRFPSSPSPTAGPGRPGRCASTSDSTPSSCAGVDAVVCVSRRRPSAFAATGVPAHKVVVDPQRARHDAVRSALPDARRNVRALVRDAAAPCRRRGRPAQPREGVRRADRRRRRGAARPAATTSASSSSATGRCGRSLEAPSRRAQAWTGRFVLGGFPQRPGTLPAGGLDLAVSSSHTEGLPVAVLEARRPDCRSSPPPSAARPRSCATARPACSCHPARPLPGRGDASVARRRNVAATWAVAAANACATSSPSPRRRHATRNFSPGWRRSAQPSHGRYCHVPG